MEWGQKMRNLDSIFDLSPSTRSDLETEQRVTNLKHPHGVTMIDLRLDSDISTHPSSNF